jgi:hypothetical protein
MAATFNWCEDHGAQTGSPLHGTTRDGFGADTNYAVNCNWKATDDTNVTAYSAAPIGPPPAFSMPKYQYGHISGAFNQISACKWTAHDDVTAFGANIALHGAVTSTYATPTAADKSFAIDFTSQVAVAGGQAVNFSTTGPEAAGPTSTLSAEGYTQYLASQLAITAGVAPGDTAQVTTKIQYNEN